MKALITTLFLLLSIAAHADDGNVLNVVEDDGGAKIVLDTEPTSGSSKSEKSVKTYYLSNTQPNYLAEKKTLDEAKLKKSRLSVTKGKNSLSLKPAGK